MWSRSFEFSRETDDVYFYVKSSDFSISISYCKKRFGPKRKRKCSSGLLLPSEPSFCHLTCMHGKSLEAGRTVRDLLQKYKPKAEQRGRKEGREMADVRMQNVAAPGWLIG